MVNAQMLIDHTKKYKMARDTMAEYHRQLFLLHPEVAKYYDAEDIDPDSIARSQRFMMLGQQELMLYFRLPSVASDEKQWRSALGNIKEFYSDTGFPPKEFNKVVDSLMAAMEKNAGGVNAEQRKNWEELFNKAYADMKSWGYF